MVDNITMNRVRQNLLEKLGNKTLKAQEKRKDTITIDVNDALWLQTILHHHFKEDAENYKK